ncbi:MAG: precorrin-3B C(17)-methyltransferase [Coriobacteriia bacterium]|nr:precorrin-3B C(17)-methyltransferase [Coriobacteriia bacterium]
MKHYAVYYFTDEGKKLAHKLKDSFQNAHIHLADKNRYPRVSQWTMEHFHSSDALIFIGACGIAVRSIAPYIEDKSTDPAVLVIDEKARFVIPILSGHLGGAAALADELAPVLGAEAVQTTASEVRGIQAVDSWAKAHKMHIENPEEIVSVSSTKLKGARVGLVVSERDIKTPFEKTLYLRPQNLLVGIGAKAGIDFEVLKDFVLKCFDTHELSTKSIAQIASIDKKSNERALIELAHYFKVPFVTYSEQELSQVNSHVSHSQFVKDTVGVDCVCEQAALYAAGKDACLLLEKQVLPGIATLALAKTAEYVELHPYMSKLEEKDAWLEVVGIGPGGRLDMSQRAYETLQASQVILGYKRYIDLIRQDFPDKECIASPMKSEIDRAKEALRLARTKRVALISSGDAGVYGMASLVYELVDRYDEFKGIPVGVVAGITAALSAAAVLGAPLSNDFATISLSDLLTPRKLIEARLKSLAQADIPLVIYNPRSKGRPHILDEALEILRSYKEPDTLIAWVKNAGRAGQESEITTLDAFKSEAIDMLTTIIVGSSQTRLMDSRLVTPRGYAQKEEF